MATQTIQLTPITDQTPAIVEVARELSGPQWCARFPGENTMAAIHSDFRPKVNSFLSALTNAGVSYSISAVYRPASRAYLMHFCAKIAMGSTAPSDVPIFDGVNIEWDHGNITASRAAANAMRNGYNIVYPPAYPTRHSLRLAIDMTLGNFINKTVKNASGIDVLINQESDLYPVGATYGVIKLVADRPHWSDNGH